MMKSARTACYLLAIAGVSGCAHIDFGGQGLAYYTPKPYLFVSTTQNCETKATVVSVPGQKKVLKFVPGYGSSNLSVTLSNGMLASVGQQSNTEVPETLASLASLGTAAAAFQPRVASGKKVICTPAAKLYPIVAGVPDLNHPLAFPVSKETIDLGTSKK